MLQLSRREKWLLGAALNPDATAAVANWQEWASEVQLEDAPYPELRMLTAVYAHLTRVAPSFKLPNKLRGKARATFTENNMMANGCLPIISELSHNSPVLLAKGLAMCVRFDSWSSRRMGDVDIHVPYSALAKACEILAKFGWIPKYSMTWNSLLNRSSLRRNSWNVTKGHFDLDLHWRLKEGPDESWLSRHMWNSVEGHEFLDRRLLLQSAEFAFVTSLEHGFRVGTHADALQTIVDAASLLPVCDIERLNPLLDKMNLLPDYIDLLSILETLGRENIVSKGSIRSRVSLRKIRQQIGISSLSHHKPKSEPAILRQPIRYRAWRAFNKKQWIERLMLRLSGPFSKPIAYSEIFKEDYNLCDCATLDQIAGPGWGWPEPEQTCFWSDRSDARLLIPLRQVGDHLIVLSLGEHRCHSPNGRVKIFANGVHLSTLDIKRMISEFCLIIPRSALFGPWVEISLRPEPYRGDTLDSVDDYSLQRSVPVRRLRIFDMQQISEVFSGYPVPQLYFTVLKGEEPQASKFARIKEKIVSSPFRSASELPRNFNPIFYILLHADLLEAEVDPFEHYLHHGRHEGRLWS